MRKTGLRFTWNNGSKNDNAIKIFKANNINFEYSGCIYKEKFENEQQEYLRRYAEVMKKFNAITLLELPERVKQILQKTTDLKTKVLMLEEIASIL